MSDALEYNFDGLVGPTHNYAGLSFGNIASTVNAGSTSNPKAAAKQGLQKMLQLMELGIPQAVIPPHQRPNLELLRSLGFTGDTGQILQKAYKYKPQLLAACYSAASMWTANMATHSPSCNATDGKLHITPANLTYNLHRAQEAEFSYKLLAKIFSDVNKFTVHAPLLAYKDLSDEGAANHNILCKNYGVAGLEIYVYGRSGLQDNGLHTEKFPARQSLLASSSIVRAHKLDPNKVIFLQQNPKVIDAGVFHNDVICVMNKNVLFYHAEAFLNWEPAKKQIIDHFAGDCHFIEISAKQLSLADAIETYIFNSQLVSLPGTTGDMALIVPMECKKSAPASAVLNSIVAQDNPIREVHYVECRESMRNGGGPACLRLRVTLTMEQSKSILQNIILDHKLYSRLNVWVEKHYRDTLEAKDLLDPLLVQEVCVALDELTKILNLGSIYPFQQS